MPSVAGQPMEDKSNRANDREAVLREVEKLAASSLLHTSESLCNLLRYLAHQAVEHPDASPKEYQIATEVFGRRADFDPRLDSTVRVQTGRLRSKLAEYYAGSGGDDELILAIPKGSYSLTFQHRVAPAAVLSESAQSVAKQIAATRRDPSRLRQFVANPWAYLFLALLGTAAIAIIARQGADRRSWPTSGPTSAFWHIFLSDKQPPLVIFSNAEFVGDPTAVAGMHYFNPANDSPTSIRDHYTGVGEVFAVHALDTLFAGFSRQIRVKRGRQLAWDEAKDNNLIFLGSTTENLSLREFPKQCDFVFKSIAGPPGRGDWEILNVHPGLGEQATFVGAPGLPTTEDYAVIALVPAFASGHWVLILAGTTTLGTQAAVEFVCRPESLGDLVDRLHLSASGSPVAFEAVIKAEIAQDVPVQTEIVALHTRPPNH